MALTKVEFDMLNHRFLLLPFLALISGSVAAADIYQVIRLEAAKRGGCTVANPCMIKVSKEGEGYSVLLNRAARITDYGEINFTTSALWLLFDLDGKFIRSTPTP